MKKAAILLGIMLYLTWVLFLPVSASCTLFSEDAARDFASLSDETETKHEGYLVGLSCGVEETALAVDGEWDVILPDVILTDDLSFARSLLLDGTAEYVETNDMVRLFDTETGDAGGNEDGWVYEATNAAYAETLGLSGNGVRIAVIDSGVDLTNEDLQHAAIEAGYDYLAESSKTMCDTVGHGTNVVQIIAADRNDKGGTGIARGAVVVPLRCFGSNDDATIATLARAIRDAAENYNCDIINMSWGLNADNQTLHEAVRYAHERGCILTASAGNVEDGYPQGTVLYPAAYDEVIGVGSVTRTMEIAATSQQTLAVSVCAPGNAVPTWSDGKNTTSSGTSFAAPCVAALLSLARERLPSLDGTLAQKLVRERAVDRGTVGYDTAYGYGTLDARTMFGQSWCYCRQEGSSTILSGWAIQLENCRNVAALYKQSGQMAACTFLLESEDDVFEYRFSNVTGEMTCRLFCLDADYRPVR